MMAVCSESSPVCSINKIFLKKEKKWKEAEVVINVKDTVLPENEVQGEEMTRKGG